MNMALDCGCGPGRLAIDITKHFNQVVAYDYEPAFVKMMEKRAPSNLTCFVGDSTQ